MQAVINLILLILVPLVLGITSHSPLRDLGLQFDRWWLQAAVGVVAFLAIQPVTLAIQLVTTKLWENNPHPLYKMIQDELSPGVPQLAILMAVIVAPIFEEILFRGIIQSWLVSLGARRRRKSTKEVAETTEPEFMPSAAWEPAPAQLAPDAQAPVLATIVPPKAYPSTNSPDPEPSRFASTIEKCSPPTSIAAPEVTNPYASHINDDSIAIKFEADSPTRPTSGLAGIIGTSLIFAAMHGAQWPAPIALFVLSMVIGYVYHRTGSLLSAICMHAAFNGFSTLLLLGFLLVPQSARNPQKDEKPGVPAVSFSVDLPDHMYTSRKIRIPPRIFVDGTSRGC